MSNLYNFAQSELEYAGFSKPNSEYNNALKNDVLELIEVFSNQGHSGFSASIVVDIFSKLASFKPISPLTGEDDEWNEIQEGSFQNKRYSGLFKDKDRFNGQAYDIYGKIFRDPDGSQWTSADSFVVVDFPYVPKTEIVDVTPGEEEK